MRKPTAKMIEALVELFGQNGGYVTSLPGVTVSTWAGLVERELVTAGPRHALTDAGLCWLVDNGHAVVDANEAALTSRTAALWAGSWISASVTPLTADQVTAELIRFQADRAQEAADLAKADAIRERRALAALPVGAPVRRKLDGARGVVVAHHGTTAEVALAAGVTVAGAPGAFELDTDTESDRVHNDANRAWANGVRAEASERADVVALIEALPEAVAALEDEELSDRDAGLIEATVRTLTDGRASAVTNLPDGGRAWTPVDGAGEFDRAAERAPGAAWVRPELWQAAGALFAPTAKRTLSELGTPVEISDQQHATDLARATGARAVTVEQVRGGVVVSSVTGDANGPLTAARFADHGDFAPEFDPSDRATDHGYFGPEVTDAPTTLSVVKLLGRLRRGLVIERAERVALADLLDTVRRSEASYGHSTAFGAWHDISNTYRAHFGDPR